MIAAMALLTVSAMAQRQQRELSAADKIMMDQKNAFLAGMGDVMEKLEQYNKLYYQTSNRDSVSRLMEPYRKIYLERMTDYVKKYPSTALAANFLCMNTGRMTLEQLKEAYNKLDETAKQTSAGKEIAAEIATLDRVAPGNPAPEIAKNDLVTGKPFALSSLKGKVVLLDFWASWCVPCRKSNPHVKALYEKYRKKGFDVVYVADNDSRPEEALKAIDQDGIRKYHHVLRGLKTLKDANGKMTGYDKSEDVSEQYAIHFLPTKYLIDREGKIIGKVTDEELDAKLKEIFGF
jgi:thiol-disulfide isomerase/thioredoxin